MKLKNHKALTKRIKITKTGKIIRRHAGQSHFNSRDSGSITRKKRRDITFSKVYLPSIKTLIPRI